MVEKVKQGKLEKQELLYENFMVIISQDNEYFYVRKQVAFQCKIIKLLYTMASQYLEENGIENISEETISLINNLFHQECNSGFTITGQYQYLIQLSMVPLKSQYFSIVMPSTQSDILTIFISLLYTKYTLESTNDALASLLYQSKGSQAMHQTLTVNEIIKDVDKCSLSKVMSISYLLDV